MSLDILTPKGQESAREEQEMLDSLRITFPDSMFVNTPKHQPARVDGLTFKDGRLTGCFESKCRKMTRQQLAEWGDEWLVTYEKIVCGANLARGLGVPFYGFLYLVPDKRIIVVKIADSSGELLPRIRLERTVTQRTVNGGQIVRTNAYIDVSMNKRTIDAAIRHLGVEIQHKRGSGYFYFTSIETGASVGESVMVCYYDHLTIDQWVKEAEEAVK